MLRKGSKFLFEKTEWPNFFGQLKRLGSFLFTGQFGCGFLQTCSEKWEILACNLKKILNRFKNWRTVKISKKTLKITSKEFVVNRKTN